MRVLIMNNSTAEFGIAAYCAAQNWEYCPMGGNAGLPRAYNAALDRLKDSHGLMVLLDDDTAVTAQYFSALVQQAAEVEADVYLPVVHDGRGMLSPCRIKGHRVGRLTSIEAWSQEMTAINTGMALRLPVILGLRYDERYFLDYADHDFVRRLKAAGARFCLLHITLKQEFSNNLRGNREDAMIRFRLFIKDFQLFCSDNASGKAHGRLYVIKRGLVLAARYQSTAFLVEAFKRHQ